MIDYIDKYLEEAGGFLGIDPASSGEFIAAVKALAESKRPKRLAGSSQIMGVVVDWDDNDKFINVAIDDSAAIRLFPEEAAQLARNINLAVRYFDETSIQA